MSSLANMPAFPRPRGSALDESGSNVYCTQQRGMTLRQHFAGLAMQGLLADHKDHEDERGFEDKPVLRPDGSTSINRFYTETCPEAVARLAVEHADALIARLEK